MKKPSNQTPAVKTAPKHPATSKTIITNLAALAAVFYPPVTAAVAANPEAAVGVVVLANLILRAVTNRRISLFPDDEAKG